MAARLVMSQTAGGAPVFPCGGCKPCSEVFSELGLLSIVISGFSNCGCVPLVADNTSLQIVGVSGVTGGFSQSWPGSSIGTVSVQGYDLGDLACGLPFGGPSLFTVTLNLACVGNRIFPTIEVGGFDPPFETLFSTATGGLLGEVILNDIVCTSGLAATVGSVQVSL